MPCDVKNVLRQSYPRTARLRRRAVTDCQVRLNDDQKRIRHGTLRLATGPGHPLLCELLALSQDVLPSPALEAAGRMTRDIARELRLMRPRMFSVDSAPNLIG